MTRKPNVSGRFRKAVASSYAAFTTAGGLSFLDAWHQTGKVTGAAVRGVVVGVVTGVGSGVVTAYVPNDPPAKLSRSESSESNRTSTPPTDSNESVSRSKASPPAFKSDPPNASPAPSAFTSPAPITIAAGLSPPPKEVRRAPADERDPGPGERTGGGGGLPGGG